jgi:PKHD-type hydroxylase
MLLQIPDVLDKDQLTSVRQYLDQADFVHGKATAGKAAGTVKHNLELDREAPMRDRLVDAVMGSLLAHPIFQAAAYPAKVSTPIFARYNEGMGYGDHVDDPVMGESDGRYRSDVSLTLFLNDPGDYEGGELVIETHFGEQQVKLPAGHVVLYPSSSRHHVEPVTVGERLVMVTWLQSQVREAERRALLFDLWSAREKLLAEAPEDEATKRVDVSYVNLLRMWVEI